MSSKVASGHGRRKLLSAACGGVLAVAFLGTQACNAFLDDYEYMPPGSDASVADGSGEADGSPRVVDAGADAAMADASPDAADASTDASSGGPPDATSDGATPDAGDAEAGAPTAYAALVISDGPVAYWRLGEPSGATVAVSQVSPAAYNGTYYSGNTLGVSGAIVGDVDTALNPNGVGGVAISANAPIFSSAPFTIEFWAKPAAAPNINQLTLFHAGNSGGGTVDISYQSTGGGGLQGKFATATGTVGFVSSTNPTVGVWNYFVITSTGGQATLYLNGQQVASVGLPAFANPSSSGDMSLGSAGGGNGFSDGVDEYAIYTTALSPSTIGRHYAFGHGITNGG